MKRILSIIAVLLLAFTMWFNNTTFATSLFNLTVWTSESEIPYCEFWDCWLENWIDSINDVDALETWRSASDYIQAIVKYILGFLMLMATLIIIYAWFVLMFGLWDEDKAKKTKNIMIYAIIWLVIIFLAGPLSDFIFNILNA